MMCDTYSKNGKPFGDSIVFHIILRYNDYAAQMELCIFQCVALASIEPKELQVSFFSLFFWYAILTETDTPGGVSLRGRDSVELPKRNPNRIRGFDYSQNGAYFVTICTQNRQRILSKIVGTPVPGCPQAPCPELLSYGKIADKYIRQMNTFYDHLSVDKYVIMPDHIHFLISIHEQVGHPGRGVPTPRTSVVARFVGTFKRFCNKEYGQNIWQARYYDHVIRNQQDYDGIWEYIDNNPRKWMMTKQGKDA